MIQTRVIAEFRVEQERAKQPGYVSKYDDDYDDDIDAEPDSAGRAPRRRGTLQHAPPSAHPVARSPTVHAQPAQPQPPPPHIAPARSEPPEFSRAARRPAQRDRRSALRPATAAGRCRRRNQPTTPAKPPTATNRAAISGRGCFSLDSCVLVSSLRRCELGHAFGKLAISAVFMPWSRTSSNRASAL